MSQYELQRPTGTATSRLAAEVSVITTGRPDGSAGITASAGVSLSLRPPRLLVWLLGHLPLAASLQRASSTGRQHARLQIAEHPDWSASEDFLSYVL